MQFRQRFTSRILLPSLAAVLLFMAAIYLFVIPNYRESLMDGKRETIRELTATAWSVLHKLDMMVDSEFTLKNAQIEAIAIISDMRYGPEQKDYFWITDTTPVMVMHPYRPSMNGMNLTNYQDQRGKNFFMDIVEIIKKDNHGYVDYKWQWKDDSLTVVPKLSYVKAFEPWGWIVGTGIYIEDVNREISNLTEKVLWISILVTILIATVILYLTRKNYVAENERQKVQERLRDSMERYKKLVEASTDGVLMVIENEIVYCNPYLLSLLEYAQEDFDQKNPQFYNTINNLLLSNNEDPKDSGTTSQTSEISKELRLSKKTGIPVDVVVNCSTFDLAGREGTIYTVKDVSKNKDIERELDLSMEKFKSIAGMMSLGVFRCTLGRESRFVEINPVAMKLLGFISNLEVKETKVMDMFTIDEEKKEVIRTLNEGTLLKDKLLHIRRPDGTVLPALVSLFPVHDAHGKTVFCDGIIVDAYDHLCHHQGFEKSSPSIHLSANVLLRPVKDYILSAPFCAPQTPVAVAAKIMIGAKSDIILVINDSENIVGLLSHSDISRRIVSQGKPTDMPISEIMSSPVISVTEEDMVMDAFTLMIQHRISYVVVKTSSKNTYNYLSLLSLSEMRQNTPEYLVNSIQKTTSVYEIANIMGRLPRLVKILVESGTGVAATGKLISRVSDIITIKIVEQAIAELGTPPAPFVFMALGSEGRMEQTLATDQDNAIVFMPSETVSENQCLDYFMKLGEKTCTALAIAGYPLCKGGVMAMNAEWCMSFDNWTKHIGNWINIPNPQEILNISIFFDFRPIYGDFSIANALQDYCLKSLKNKNIFYFNLARSIINLKPAGIEGNAQEPYDIKLPALAITSIARLWALKFGISERNTLARFLALESAGVITTALREDFDQAYRYLMSLRIKSQLRQIESGNDLGNDILPKHLSEFDRIMFKKIIAVISDHLARLGLEFRIS
jgi:PAS domain S-box-containing protein